VSFDDKEFCSDEHTRRKDVKTQFSLKIANKEYIRDVHYYFDKYPVVTTACIFNPVEDMVRYRHFQAGAFPPFQSGKENDGNPWELLRVCKQFVNTEQWMGTIGPTTPIGVAANARVLSY